MITIRTTEHASALFLSGKPLLKIKVLYLHDSSRQVLWLLRGKQYFGIIELMRILLKEILQSGDSPVRWSRLFQEHIFFGCSVVKYDLRIQ
jgi:hypothetical protein